jgi:DNA-binding CsgD family transcriptional regulator
MHTLDDDVLLSRLGDLAAACETAAFLAHAHALLETIAPHRTASAWCGMQAMMLGEEAEQRRDHAHKALRASIERARLEHPPPDSVLPFIRDSMLAGNTLLTVLAEPPPDRVRALAMERLSGAPDHVKAVFDSQGWKHALIVPLHAVEDELSSGIVLYRMPEEGEFDETQIAHIETIRPLLSSLLAHLLEHQQQQSVQSDILDFLADLPVGLILYDARRRPLFVNEEGYRQTQLWLHAPAIPPRGDAKASFRLPPEIHAAGERLRQRWLSDALGFAPARSALSESVSHPLRNDMKATVTIAQAKDDIARPPGMLVRYSGMAARVEATFQPSPAQLSILSQLTPGERNVALLVMRGMSNQDIADALHRDITTVKDHLSHIYDKLGIRGRTQLMAMLAG